MRRKHYGEIRSSRLYAEQGIIMASVQREGAGGSERREDSLDGEDEIRRDFYQQSGRVFHDSRRMGKRPTAVPA